MAGIELQIPCFPLLASRDPTLFYERPYSHARGFLWGDMKRCSGNKMLALNMVMAVAQPIAFKWKSEALSEDLKVKIKHVVE